jgi:hypothetical protein
MPHYFGYNRYKNGTLSILMPRNFLVNKLIFHLFILINTTPFFTTKIYSTEIFEKEFELNKNS